MSSTSKPDTPTTDGTARTNLLCTAVTALIAGCIIAPKIIWGPCFGDPGEVQLTAAVGGVGHPPGQAGIISIMRLLCVVSPLEPHVTVSAANAVFALTSVVLLCSLQLRTGAHPVAAVLCSLWFLADDQFWHAATVPETYATCVALLICSIRAFVGWLDDRKTWKFAVAALLYVYLVVNRAPTLTLSVAYVVVLLHHRGARACVLRQPARHVGCIVVAAAIALCATWGALWMRDVPDAKYNYLDQSHPSLPDYPASNVSSADRAARLWWLVSAKQYAYMFEPSARTLRGQTEFLRVELGARYPVVASGAVALIVLGAWSLYRRDRSLAAFVLLMIPGAVAPILMIRVIHHTAMIPNLMLPLTWLAGLGMSRLIRWCGSTAGKTVVVAGMVSVFWWTADESVFARRDAHDASDYLRRVDLETLPSNATLITAEVIPLVYQQQVRGIRPDVNVLLHHGRLNHTFLASLQGPIYTTTAVPSDADAERVGDGPIWEIRLHDSPAEQRPVPD